jgi:hypothetical protein
MITSWFLNTACSICSCSSVISDLKYRLRGNAAHRQSSTKAVSRRSQEVWVSHLDHAQFSLAACDQSRSILIRCKSRAHHTYLEQDEHQLTGMFDIVHLRKLLTSDVC